MSLTPAVYEMRVPSADSGVSSTGAEGTRPATVRKEASAIDFRLLIGSHQGLFANFGIRLLTQ